MTVEDILKTLCTSFYTCSENNPTGREIKNIMRPLSEDISEDPLGNIICTLKSGEDKTLVLSAHMDKIGMSVTGIDKDTGMLRLSKAGGIDIRVLPAARIKVLGKKELKGCISSTPPHLSKGERKEAAPLDSLFADCGMKYEKISELVNIGDRAEFDEPFIKLGENRCTSPYLDNCAGCAVIIKTAELIKNADVRCNIKLIFTTREEVGSGGAAAAAFSSAADMALITDVSFGTYPGVEEYESSPLSSGAMICVSPVLQKNISDRLKAAAVKNNIPFTLEIAGGRTGTDSDVFVNSREGIKTGLVSVPLLNMHTPAETVDLRDIDAAARLFAEFIKEEY